MRFTGTVTLFSFFSVFFIFRFRSINLSPLSLSMLSLSSSSVSTFLFKLIPVYSYWFVKSAVVAYCSHRNLEKIMKWLCWESESGFFLQILPTVLWNIFLTCWYLSEKCLIRCSMLWHIGLPDWKIDNVFWLTGVFWNFFICLWAKSCSSFQAWPRYMIKNV